MAETVEKLGGYLNRTEGWRHSTRRRATYFTTKKGSAVFRQALERFGTAGGNRTTDLYDTIVGSGAALSRTLIVFS